MRTWGIAAIFVVAGLVVAYAAVSERIGPTSRWRVEDARLEQQRLQAAGARWPGATTPTPRRWRHRGADPFVASEAELGVRRQTDVPVQAAIRGRQPRSTVSIHRGAHPSPDRVDHGEGHWHADEHGGSVGAPRAARTSRYGRHGGRLGRVWSGAEWRWDRGSDGFYALTGWAVRGVGR